MWETGTLAPCNTQHLGRHSTVTVFCSDSGSATSTSLSVLDKTPEGTPFLGGLSLRLASLLYVAVIFFTMQSIVSGTEAIRDNMAEKGGRTGSGRAAQWDSAASDSPSLNLGCTVW